MHSVKTTRSLLLAAVILTSGQAFAQLDLSGEIFNLRFHEEGWEEEIGDYAGVPVNESARLRADTWLPSLLTLPEHQCKPHGADRVENFGGMRIWKEVNLATQELTAYHILVQWMLMHRVIYMDGRPHPPEYAPRSFMGFSSGGWDGNSLRFTTTHLKESWLRRNGLVRSEKARLTERLVKHGDILVWVFMIDDPAYMTEPYIRSRQAAYRPEQGPFPVFPCEITDIVARERGEVPHHLPGTNPDLLTYGIRYGIPQEAARGGRETMYPEYMIRLEELWERDAGNVASR
jgi:hypothetical protein